MRLRTLAALGLALAMTSACGDDDHDHDVDATDAALEAVRMHACNMASNDGMARAALEAINDAAESEVHIMANGMPFAVTAPEGGGFIRFQLRLLATGRAK